MRTKILNKITNDILELKLVQQHTRVDDNYDDALISMYISAATDLAEKSTNRMLTKTSIAGYWKEYNEKVFLPYGNATKPTKLTALDSELTVTNIDFTFNEIDESITITGFNNYTDFNVEYECGYDEVPKGIQQGMLLLIGTLYNVREDVSYGVQAYSVPVASKMLFDKYRIHAVGGV